MRRSLIHMLGSAAVVALAGLPAAACAGLAPFVPTPASQERDVARTLEPESLAAPPPDAALPDLGVLRIRAYLDEAFTRGVRDPEARVRESIADASAILRAQLGASLELVDVRTFEPASRELPDALDELRKLDGARDVDLVVGFLRAEPFVTSSLHRLGYADVLGHHAVVRALDDRREADAIDRLLRLLPADERAKLVERRRRHKAAVVLLHEIAHALGGVHVADPESVLFPSYSIDQNRLDEDALALLEQGLAWHRARTDDERTAAAARLAEQLAARRARLDPAGVDDALAAMTKRAHNALVLPAADARAFNGALAAARAGDGAAAWGLLAPLAVEGAAPEVLTLACVVSSVPGAVVLDAKARCERALAASPDEIEPVAAALAVAARTHDDAFFAAALDEGAARVARRPKASPALVSVAGAASARRRYTLAEDALALAGALDGAAEERARVKLARRRHGVRRGAVAPAVEPALVAEIDAVEVDAGDHPKAALARIDADLARYGDVAGLLAARCEAEGRLGRLGDAAKACARALSDDDEDSRAHAFAGLVEGARGHVDRAEAEFVRALALDPDATWTWQALRSLLQRAGRGAAAADVDRRYRARFGADLPAAPARRDARAAPSAN